MNRTVLEYKGYCGSVEIDTESGTLYGKVEFINDLITFEAENVKEIKKEFEAAVDDYLDFCKTHEKNPDKSFKGSFNVRVSPENHRQAALLAYESGQTLNQFVESAICEKIQAAIHNGEGRESQAEGFLRMKRA